MRELLKKTLENFTNRKASMTLVAYGMVILVCLIAGHFKPMEANLPTVLGTIVAILTVFLTGHAVDQKWSPPTPPPGEKAVIAAAVKVVAKVEKKAEEGEESC